MIMYFNSEKADTNIDKEIDKKGEIKESKEDNVTPNKTTVISKVNIDFFGNITEV